MDWRFQVVRLACETSHIAVFMNSLRLRSGMQNVHRQVFGCVYGGDEDVWQPTAKRRSNVRYNTHVLECCRSHVIGLSIILMIGTLQQN